MRLLNLKCLDSFKQKHSDARSQINSWIAEVEEAVWLGPMDVKERYHSASFLRDNRVIFNIKGNNYRLDVRVHYEPQIVRVIRAGTHAEYDEWEF